jgi:nitrite reductase/ring-hydroxylating ferredoxin subunit
MEAPTEYEYELVLMDASSLDGIPEGDTTCCPTGMLLVLVGTKEGNMVAMETIKASSCPFRGTVAAGMTITRTSNVITPPMTERRLTR